MRTQLRIGATVGRQFGADRRHEIAQEIVARLLFLACEQTESVCVNMNNHNQK